MDAEVTLKEFAPEDALATVDTTIQLQRGLRSRTEGITWMVWGLVIAGWTLSYDAVAWITRPNIPGALLTFMWLPWVAVGGVTTWALWRTAAVATPELSERQPVGWLVTAAWTAAVMAVYAVVMWAQFQVAPQMDPDTISLVALGATWLAFGAVDPLGLTPRGRLVCTLVGLGMLATGLAIVPMLPADMSAANRVSTPVMVVVGGALPLLGGLWQSFRG